MIDLSPKALLAGPAGGLCARPWFDSVVLGALKHVFFPTSRLWAAAEEANGDQAQFFDRLDLTPTIRRQTRAAIALARFELLQQAAALADQAWEAAFFGPEDLGNAACIEAEARRRAARDALNRGRSLFKFLLFDGIPMMRRETPGPDQVAAVYDRAVTEPAEFFAPADPMPPVARSRAISLDGIDHYWLRFDAPFARLGDEVYAHVYEPVSEPAGAAHAPTVILGHGICVEFDHWQGLLDEAEVLCRAGMRVVRPEAPFHGRRRGWGFYGGEEVMAHSPLSALDCFVGAVGERAVLMDWCRRTFGAPVALGGSSLGAMMALAGAEQSHDWPQALRPDGLIMITQCERPFEALVQGAIARTFSSEQTKKAAGWTEDLLRRYLSILDPVRPPVMAPENIVCVLGTKDTVTPFDSGLALLDRWRVPEGNRFIWPCGHFTVPMRLARDPSPLHHFAKRMQALT